MQSRQKSSLSSVESDGQRSNNTFQYESDPRPLEEQRSLFSFQETRCSLCINHYIILQQLRLLREAVVAKNQKIREL